MAPPSRRTTPGHLRTTTSALPAEYRGKSWEKCKEYSKAVYRKEVSPVLILVPEDLEVKECSMAQELIFGGQNCTPKEFPHMAAIGYGEHITARSWLCGGSLISNRFVLTAAHCLFHKNLKQARRVRLGDLNLARSDDDAMPVTHEVEELIPHEAYSAGAYYNDIGLLRLKTEVSFNAYVRPACLNTFMSTPRGGRATATGWGRTKWSGQGSENLMKADLHYNASDICSTAFEALTKPGFQLFKGYSEDSMICAGDPYGQKDTCVGDSGGPLQVPLGPPFDCMHSIVGLTSFGFRVCADFNPAVYTRVSHFVPWIESKVWPN